MFSRLYQTTSRTLQRANSVVSTTSRRVATSSASASSRRVKSTTQTSLVPTRNVSEVRSAFSTKSAWWGDVPMGPKDPILGVTEAFLADKSPQKFNLGVGAYRDDNGKPTILKSVRVALDRLHQKNMDNEYAPIAGIKDFVEHAAKLSFITDTTGVIQDKRYAAIQSLSGTGALRIAGEYLHRFKPLPIYLPNPTWGNHIPIFEDSGLKVHYYRYYDAKTKGLDFAGLLEDLNKIPQSAILFHVCAHNPTGVDPTPQQWAEISALCKKKNHFVVLDFAYQGFASGDPAKDALSVGQFTKDGHQVAVCQSFAKNFGLYGQRVGCLSFMTQSAEESGRVESQLKILARPIYSNPPIQGARIISTVLGDPELAKQWRVDVKEMADRIMLMRKMLVDALKAAGSTHNWQHVTDQIGMFCYSGMSGAQVDELSSKHHIYLTRNGRISLAGITSKDIKPIAEAIHQVTKNAPL